MKTTPHDFIFELERHASEEAYYKAFEKLFGDTAPFLWTRLKHRMGTGTFDRNGVLREMRELFSPQTVLEFEKLALNNPPLGESIHWSSMIEKVGPSYHPVHFTDSHNEARIMIDYLERGLRRGPKVKIVCSWYKEGIDSMRRMLVRRSGNKHPMLTQRVMWMPMEGTRDQIVKDGSIARASSDFEEMLARILGRGGYSEVWFAGVVSSGLFQAGEYELAREWEIFTNERMIDLSPAMSAYCTYPLNRQEYEYASIRKIVGPHNWLVLDEKALPLSLASQLGYYGDT